MTAATLPSPPIALPREAADGAIDDPLEWDDFTRWQATANGGRIGESGLQVSGMHCAACSVTIEQALLALPGVLAVQASAASGRAQVRWDPAHTLPSRWLVALRAAGYDAVPDAAAPARALRRAESRRLLWRLFVAAFCAMQVMMFASATYFTAPGEIDRDSLRLLNWGSWVLTLPVLAFSSLPFFAGAWRALRRRRVAMDVPVALGIAVTFVASTGATFEPGGPFGHDVYFDSLTMFVAFLLGGRWLEMRLRHRAAESFEQALARLPEFAERQQPDGSWETISLRRLVAGDVIRVPLGAAFPADGVLTRGRTEADEALLSGESAPVAKAVGDEVVAGSINLGAPVLMRAVRVGSATRAQGIVAMMRSALSERPSADAMGIDDRVASAFLWSVLLLAALAGAAWSLIDPSQVVRVVAAVLIVTCPCALSLAAPAAWLAAAGRLARRGVVLQRLSALAPLARARRLFVDKTGTLTLDRPRLARVRLLTAEVNEQQAREISASLAAWSQHPLARALREGSSAGDAGPWRALHEHAGSGLQAEDAQGRRWRLGSAAWCGAPEDGRARVWLACEGRPVAAFEFDEVLRDDALPALKALHDLGWHITVLSGDAPERVQRLAARLPLDATVAAATPEMKLAHLLQAHAEGGPVVMLGDGINDAPVLAAADVSLAMGQGALIARAHADGVIASDRLQDLVHAHLLARRAAQVVRQNLLWAAGYNAACIPLALAGWLPPWAAGLGMALSSLAVVANARRVDSDRALPNASASLTTG